MNLRPFETIEEMQHRAKVNKTAIESLKHAGVIDGMPEANQICMF